MVSSPSTYYLSIGSNIQPEKNVPACLILLKQRFPTIIFSSIYETDPVGPAGTKKFWNLAAKVTAPIPSLRFKEMLLEIESTLGRVRSASNRFLPRVIDIDILPQQDYHRHAFIMLPLAEIAANDSEGPEKKTFGEYAQALRAQGAGFRRIELANLG